MLDRSDLSKIGIGTWGIGGFMERDTSIDEQKQINAIAYMLDNGLNYLQINNWYSQGYSAEITAKALKQSQKSREDIFICQAIYLNGTTLTDIEKEVDKVCGLLGTSYIDTLQVKSDAFPRFGYTNVVDTIQKLLDKGKARYTSITQENFALLKKYHQSFGEKLFSHEICVNFEIRADEIEGTPKYAADNNIITIVYQPLRRNRTAKMNWPLLVHLAQKYDATQNQIILKWLVSKGYLPLTKSESIAHIDEHLKALDIPLSEEDRAALDAFTPPGYVSPKVDWEKTGDGISVDQLSNVFDDDYNKQQAK